MPKYGPQEDGYSIFLERTFIGGLLVVGAGYGVQLVLYVTCVLHLWSQRKRRGKIAISLLIYVTLLLIIESFLVASCTWIVEDMYINNRNYPGGPLAYFLETNLPGYNMLLATLLCLTFLSDLLVIWRCWVIWNPSGKLSAYAVIALPAMLLLASLPLGITWAVESTQSLYYTTPLLTALGTAYYVTSLGVNILVTGLIILRLLLHRRAHLKYLPPEHARHYLSMTTIFVESAALYTTFALAYVITFALDSPMNQIFLGASSACQQIAGYLIILRLARGVAWGSNTLTKAETQLTTMHFEAPVAKTEAEAGPMLETGKS
ncbi:hypothetical protein AX15_006437 [Amanita polypyramis BW_CC]|nr:hypothetical protein AX15_006437 [Amanita polypyramis BW_CC]